ncbi:hypothetical protein GGI12_005771, partial [Dipsacomyces acuminosporus]
NKLLLALFLFAQAVSAAHTHALLGKRHGAHSHDHDHGGDEGSHGGSRDEELNCYASGVDDWSVGLHVGAIFIILGVSGLGAFIPVLSHYVPALHVPPVALTLGKFLGTGVIISTAFIHMLPSGSENLSNPCVGDRMGNFGGWPGVLAIMAIFAMHLMEFLLSNNAMAKHSHSHGLPQDLDHHRRHAKDAASPGNLEGQGFDIGTTLNGQGSHSPPTNGSSTSTSAGSAGDKLVHGAEESANCDAVAIHTHHNHVHGLSFLSSSGDSGAAKAHASRISTYILELGICLHSVIIGITLSVTTGSEFTTLLIAVAFHQLCEGLALGSRFTQLGHAKNAFLHAILNSVIFMLITPLGMVVGVGIRYSYQPSSPAALITMGVLDCLSAGILVYSGL